MDPASPSGEPQPQFLLLVGRVGLQEFEAACRRDLTNPTGLDQLIIDMSRLTWTDPGVMSALIAIASGRERAKRRTLFKLPNAKIARQLFRNSNFQFGFESAIGKKFICYVPPEQRPLFDSSGKLLDYPDVTDSDLCMSEAAVQLMDRGFFAFRSWDADYVHPRIDFEVLRRYLKEQDLRWSDELLTALLGRYIGAEKFGYVTSHVVYEALTNAFRHANSKVVLSVEQIIDASTRNIEKQLQIAHWDNGDPVYHTLSNALSSGRSIMRSNGGEPRILFSVTSDDRRFEFGPHDVPKDVATTPLTASEEELFLLSAFIPGVTSESAGFGAIYHDSLKAKFPTLAAPGKGLYNMINAICFFFGGVATAWSGAHILSFSADRGKSDQDQRLVAFNVSSRRSVLRDVFVGNLIVAQLPFRN